MQWCGSGAAPAGYALPNPDDGDCEDCVETRVHYRTVKVPCTRNVYKTEKHTVPRQVEKKVPRQVAYTDYVTKTKQEPYTIMRNETRYKNEIQTYNKPVVKTDVITVPIHKKVPKTIWVDKVFNEQRTVQKNRYGALPADRYGSLPRASP